mmetsp:Transcript_30084/g.59086  ORF Transcript_30084/g.59086 Transcript_30084/m.59086 type:complete len:86 (+) Transcript_30084:573-830(+)
MYLEGWAERQTEKETHRQTHGKQINILRLSPPPPVGVDTAEEQGAIGSARGGGIHKEKGERMAMRKKAKWFFLLSFAPFSLPTGN